MIIVHDGEYYTVRERVEGGGVLVWGREDVIRDYDEVTPAPREAYSEFLTHYEREVYKHVFSFILRRNQLLNGSGKVLVEFENNEDGARLARQVAMIPFSLAGLTMERRKVHFLLKIAELDIATMKAVIDFLPPDLRPSFQRHIEKAESTLEAFK